MYLQVDDIQKAFGTQAVLQGVSFAAGESDFVCLLGPSGCGKTTLLRIIAGLLGHDAGRIRLGERDVTQLSARERGFGIVFQSYSLFPNMTVAQNVGYGMRIRGASRTEVAARCRTLLALVQLPDAGDKYPAQLSGGQQQRVALARALAVQPSLLLLDEPLSALDARVREQLRDELRRVQRALGVPTLMVTHDQEEALSVADRIVCMNHGRIEQVATPRELYLRPKTAFAARFVGESNLLSCAWIRDHQPELMADRPVLAGESHMGCVRPEDVLLRADPGGEARVTGVSFRGSVVRFEVDWRGQALLCEQHRDAALQVGDAVSVSVRPGRCIWVSA